MSSATYITARDLFLAHHWVRYPAYDHSSLEGFTCGRIAHKDGATIGLLTGEMTAGRTTVPVTVGMWAPFSLREPKAAEAAPPVSEVLCVGDWVGASADGTVILFAPCSQRGATALQEAESLMMRARAWAEFLARVRTFFTSQSFVEVTTPILAPSPGTEPFLDPLSLTIETLGPQTSEQTSESFKKYLITSPEFHLKKALGAGLPRIFEIARCFRNREGGAHHRIEFHMLEWYRSFATLREIANDVEALIRTFVPSAQLRHVTMTDLFREFVGFDLKCDTSRDDLFELATRLQVHTVADDDFGDLFHRIFLEKIESRFENFAAGQPVLLSGYPPSMAALARVGADGFADRFEVYWHGLELCNAFHELNDPGENCKRFEKDNQAKVRSGREPVPLDQQLLRSFDLGVPPAGGIALGLERLFMAIHNLKDIDAVRPFQSS